MGLIRNSYEFARVAIGKDTIDWEREQVKRDERVLRGILKGNQELFAQTMQRGGSYEDACLNAKLDLYELANSQLTPGEPLPKMRIAQALLESAQAFPAAYYAKPDAV